MRLRSAARSVAGAVGAGEAADPAVEGGTTAPRAGEVALVEVVEEEDMEVEGREVSEAEAAGPTAPAARRRMAAGAVDMVEADLTPGGKSSTHLAASPHASFPMSMLLLPSSYASIRSRPPLY